MNGVAIKWKKTFMIKNKFRILKIGHLQQKIIILHLIMFFDQINSLTHLLFKVSILRWNIKFKSKIIGDNKTEFLVKVLRLQLNKFLIKLNKLIKEGFIQKVHHNLSWVYLLLILQNKLNVKSIKCPKKKRFWISK